MKYSLLLVVLLTGCQGGNLTNRYQDGVDRLADRETAWEAVYNPAFDASRAGRADWRSHPMNQRLFPVRSQRYILAPSHSYSSPVYSSLSMLSGPSPRPVETTPPSNDPTLLPAPDIAPTPEVPADDAKPELPAREPEVSAADELLIPEPVPGSDTKTVVFVEVGEAPTEPTAIQLGFQWAEEVQDWKEELEFQENGNLSRKKNGAIIAPRPDGPARPVWARDIK
ncbi:MAG: hypothetical protein KDA88_09065 [Planctomycetaceae bacterium]|nr:hypothetical protein [Planctomycetaceae bacterium]MCA9031537.1 hypothetical protein [Planctomycetaceae bacterium]MCB9949792.1 hypothetical protein [Planctomycetaceae bacterium]